jgi:hypothetical protein
LGKHKTAALGLVGAIMAGSLSTPTTSMAQTWEENLAAGAATTEKNHLNVLFTLAYPFNALTHNI